MSQEAIWLEQTIENIKNKLFSSINQQDDSNFNKGKKFAFEVALCHNDVLSGNVLLHTPSTPNTTTSSLNENETIFNKITSLQQEEEANPMITLIDYEYSCYSYRAFDIANHFCGLFFLLFI